MLSGDLGGTRSVVAARNEAPLHCREAGSGTACTPSIGAPRSVMVVCPVLADATAAHPGSSTLACY